MNGTEHKWSNKISGGIMKNKIAVLSLIIFTGISLTATAGDGWNTSFEAATNAAVARGLPIFAYFSGSDWSKDCMRFDTIVLHKPEFQKFVSANFILFQADLPRKSPLPDETKKQNDALRKKYGINSYPTVLLLDSKGEIIATKNYDKGGVAKYIAELKKIIGK